VGPTESARIAYVSWPRGNLASLWSWSSCSLVHPSAQVQWQGLAPWCSDKSQQEIAQVFSDLAEAEIERRGKYSTGQPSIAEAADLLWGALRIRCQPSRTDAEPAWRDALAVASVIVPLILALVVVVDQAPVFLPGSGALARGFRLFALEAMAAPLALGVVVPLALRMRRVAALTGAGLPIVLVFGLVGHGVSVAIGEASLFLAVGLQTVALAASAGPRRGLQILTRKHAVLVLVATLLVCTRLADIVGPAGATVRLIVLTAIGAGMALTSSLGRWLLLLLAIPAWPLLLMAVPPFPGWGQHVLPSTAAVIVAWYLPPAALAALAARRASAHSPKPLGTPDA
jgi:hypothetical protein